MDTKTHEVTRRRFTVHDYHRMGEAGILHEDDRVELIEGDIVEMAAIGTRHFACVNQLTRSLVREVGDAAIVSVQNPVRLDEHTEPQSDLTVLRAMDYRESLPMPEDVMPLIEVSDTTLAYDHGVKLPLYARASRRSGSWTSHTRSLSATPTRPEMATGASRGRGEGERSSPWRCPS